MINFSLKFKKKILLTIILLLLILLILIFTFHFNNNEEQNKAINELSINETYDKQEDVNKSNEQNEKKETEKSISNESKILKKKEKSKEKALHKKKSKSNDPVKKTKVESESPSLNPIDTINELHEGLIKVSKKEMDDYKKFMPIINNTYDIQKMLNMILGSAWKNSNMDEKKKISLAFAEYITKNYLKRFIKINDVKFKIEEKKSIKNKFVMIKTTLIPNNNDAVSINYLLSNKNGKWKIFDVLLAGSVSEIATKKSEFSSFLKDGKTNNLIDALNKKNSTLLN